MSATAVQAQPFFTVVQHSKYVSVYTIKDSILVSLKTNPGLGTGNPFTKIECLELGLCEDFDMSLIDEELVKAEILIRCKNRLNYLNQIFNE